MVAYFWGPKIGERRTQRKSIEKNVLWVKAKMAKSSGISVEKINEI